MSQESQSQDEDLEATGWQQSGDEEYDDVPQYQRQEIMAAYKNLYWTRIISISHFDEEADKKCLIGPDIIHEMDELAEI